MKKKIINWLLFEKEDLDNRIRSYPKFRIILLLSAVLGFLVSLFWFWTETSSLAVKSVDGKIMVLISQIATPFLTDLFSLVTYLGSEIFMVLAVFLLSLILIIKRRKRAAAVTFLTLAGSVFFIYFFKSLFGRARPIGCLDNGDCLSFPSGHATLAFYFYGLIGYLIFRFLPLSLRAFLVLGVLIVFLIILICLSRVFLGVHYLSDILGGFFLGSSWLLLAILLIDILYSGTN